MDHHCLRKLRNHSNPFWYVLKDRLHQINLRIQKFFFFRIHLPEYHLYQTKLFVFHWKISISLKRLARSSSKSYTYGPPWSVHAVLRSLTQTYLWVSSESALEMEIFKLVFIIKINWFRIIPEARLGKIGSRLEVALLTKTLNSAIIWFVEGWKDEQTNGRINT